MNTDNNALNSKQPPKKVFYALGGPGDIIRAHKKWRKGTPDSHEISITFSSQIADYCEAQNADAYFISPHAETDKLVDDNFTLEHRPKVVPDARGLARYIHDIRHSLKLLSTARHFKADVAILDSGAIPFFHMFLFSLMGIKTVVVLHNALWATGHKPQGLKSKITQWADGLFFLRGAHAVIGVSPECNRQAVELTNGKLKSSHLALAQFWSHSFPENLKPNVHGLPFTVLYVGRLEEDKGVLDLVEIAARLQQKHPNAFKFEVWGEGGCSDDLHTLIKQHDLADVVLTPGYLMASEAPKARERSHVGIVPTRSSFAEGMAMTAIESVLAIRPTVVSSVVPAGEVLKDASVVCDVDSIDSFVEALEKLALDANYYNEKANACAPLRSLFLDKANGLEAVLTKAIG